MTEPTPQHVKIVGKPVGQTGYGLMGLTWRGNPNDLPSQETAFKAMKAALANGANFWNGGEIYGTPEHNSLHLLHDYFEKYPEDADKVVLSIKGGADKGSLKANGSAENTRRSIEECLAILDGKKKLDIWESARIDKEVPIEIMLREAEKYVKRGQIGGIGLSECSARSIRRAAKITKIAAVEVEFSLWETTILENGVAKVCAELDIPIVAYSPLGSGILTGQIKSPDDIPAEDFRKAVPRFQGENFNKNLKLVTQIEKIAKEKSCTSGQVALAWIRAQSGKIGMPTFIAIPGASSDKRVEENLTVVKLSTAELKEIEGFLGSFKVCGERYPAEAAAKLFGDSPELER